MNIWAFNRASDERIIDFVTNSLKNGVSRFGWGYKNKLDIRELAPKPWDKMSKEEIEIYNKQNFLLDIKKGDWIVHINIPTVGQVTAGQVIEEYNFDKEDNEINDFRHFFKLDKDSIVEFDRNADFVPEIISKKLKLRGRYWRIYDKHEFLEIIDNIDSVRFFDYEFSDSQIPIDKKTLLNHIKAKDDFYNYGQNNIPISDLINFIGEENLQINTEWKGESFVTNVKIKNFKIFKDIEFKLSKKINIVLGNNGLGKTSLLQALTLGLLNRDNIEENTKKFPAYINLNAEEERSEIKINWGKNEYRKLWIYSKGLPKEESPVNPPYNIMLAYGVNLNTTNNQEHTKFVEKLIIGKNKSYFTESIFEDNYSEMHDPLKILEHLDNEIKLPYHLRDELKLKIKNKNIDSEYKEIILINNLILETINNFLQLITESEQIQIHYINHVYYFKDFFGNNLKTEHLSEGYKDHILLITDIIIRILSVRSSILDKNENLEINETIFHKAKGIIIIDEFDRHLHPNWQRKLLFQLRKYFPKIQFILTTHNIFSLQSAVGATALIVKKENNKITVTNKKIPKGFSIESIYKLFFDGKGKMYDKETEESLKTFYKLLGKKRIGKITKEEEIKLKKEANKMLNSKSYEIRDIVTMEIRQFEQKTKKTIEL